jgi:hypothetical protein
MWYQGLSILVIGNVAIWYQGLSIARLSILVIGRLEQNRSCCRIVSYEVGIGRIGLMTVRPI